MATFKNINLSEINPDPNQPRKFTDESSLHDLTESIRANGVIQPIVVRPTAEDNQYMIVCGERRFRASTAAGLKDIPAIIREELTDESALEMQIIENLQRKDVHPMEEADAFLQLSKNFNAEEISLRVGKSIRFVQERIKLTTLSEKAQQLFYKNHMNLSQAQTLAKIDVTTQDIIIKDRLPNDFESNPEHHKDWNIGNVEYMVERHMHQLDGTAFDPESDVLYPLMGKCSACKYNTSNTPELFKEEEHSHCTNNVCFSIKKEKHIDLLLQEESQKPDFKGVVVNWYYFRTTGRYDAIRPYLSKYNIDLYHDDDLKKIYSPDELMTPEEWEEDNDWLLCNEGLTMESEEFIQEYNEYKQELEQDIQEYNEDIKSATKMMYISMHLGIEYHYYKFIDTEKATTSTSITTEIDNEIEKLKSREKRAKELDGEKIYEAIRQEFKKATLSKVTEYIDSKKLKKIQCAFIYLQLDWSIQQDFNEKHLNDRYPNISNLINLFFNKSDISSNDLIEELLKLLIISKCCTPGGSLSSALSNYASVQFIRVINDQYVNDIVDKFTKAAEARAAKVEARIKALTV